MKTKLFVTVQTSRVEKNKFQISLIFAIIVTREIYTGINLRFISILCQCLQAKGNAYIHIAMNKVSERACK